MENVTDINTPEQSAEEIEVFARILGRNCVENKVYLSSNERHTVYDAFKEYASQKHLPTDEEIR